jgi:transcription elongation factor Elf1
MYTRKGTKQDLTDVQRCSYFVHICTSNVVKSVRRLEYFKLQRLIRKCPRCSKGRLRLSVLEIFDRGAFSSRARAFKRITALCETCGSVSFEQQVKCPTCNHGNVRTCSAGSIRPGTHDGIQYLMRCKSCGYIWNVSFKNFEMKVSDGMKPRTGPLEPIVALAKSKGSLDVEAQGLL